MIIFGTRGVTYTKDRGQFFCPECNHEEPYHRKRVRRFFTLYFIPLIPLDVVAEYIECPHCGGTYRDSVLSYDPREQQEKMEKEVYRAIRRVMIYMMVADGHVDDAEVATICDIYGKITGSEIIESQIRREVEQVEAAGTRILDDLREMGAYLNGGGKEMVVRSALAVAAADGEFQEEEQELLQQIAESIGVTPAHLRGILSDSTEPY